MFTSTHLFMTQFFMAAQIRPVATQAGQAVAPASHWHVVLAFIVLVLAVLVFKGWRIYQEVKRTQERDGTIEGLKRGWEAGLAEQRAALKAQGLSPAAIDVAMDRFVAAARARGLDPDSRIQQMEEAGEI